MNQDELSVFQQLTDRCINFRFEGTGNAYCCDVTTDDPVTPLLCGTYAEAMAFFKKALDGQTVLTGDGGSK